MPVTGAMKKTAPRTDSQNGMESSMPTPEDTYSDSAAYADEAAHSMNDIDDFENRLSGNIPRRAPQQQKKRSTGIRGEAPIRTMGLPPPSNRYTNIHANPSQVSEEERDWYDARSAVASLDEIPLERD